MISYNSEDTGAAVEKFDLKLPRVHQVARRIEDESLQMVATKLHAHVVFGRFPVETAAALTESHGDTGALATDATGVDRVLEGREEQLLETARFGGDRVGFELRDESILRKKHSKSIQIRIETVDFRKFKVN